MKKRVFGILNVPKIRKNHLKITKSIYPAFTIVELLVVIIVIGILAIISLVSYSGISQKANVAAVTADLNNASKQFKMFNIENNTYPTSISDCPTPAAGNLCLKSSDGTSYQYTPALSNRAFCLTATKSNTSYNLTQAGQALAGPCPVLNLDAGNTLSYPGTGTSWYDLSGNNYNGTLNNGVAYQNINAGVMSFDGVDDYVALANDIVTVANIRLNGITYLTWVKSNNISLNQRVFGQKPGSGYSDFASGGLGISSSKSSMIAYDDNISYKNATGNTTLLNNTWYCIVGTYNPNDKNIRVYVNGVIDGNPVNIVTFNRLVANGGNTVGKQDHATSPYYLNGFVSRVSIYNTALSDSEILQNYNATKGRYGL